MIDLRSDTVTKPTAAMLEAMATAELGDEGYREDPTVARLERMAADLTGKEAAMYVCSGTQGNLISLLTHCGRGEEVLAGHLCHIAYNEQAGAAALGGIPVRQLRNSPDGRIDVEEIRDAISPDDEHFPRTKLICLENTFHGCVLPIDYMRSVKQLAEEHGLKVHLDGARIFNAATALAVPVKEIARYADTVQFCFSKGLSAPVGSILCGPQDFMERARRNRKLVGGTMRQAGVIAAACVVALEQCTERLSEDHENAKYLANLLASIDSIKIDTGLVHTNIVYFELKALPAERFVDELRAKGVLMNAEGPRLVRAVTHRGISKADIDRTIAVIRETRVAPNPLLAAGN